DAARRERMRLAADLHDGFQQYLAGATFRLKAAMNYLPDGAEESRAQLEKVNDALRHTQSGLRSTLWAMNEESEGPESLIELIHFVSRRLPHWEGVVEVVSEGEERKVAHNFAGTLLLVLQEAVGNAIAHGKARRVKITVAFDRQNLTLSIADDGVGFDPSAARREGHYGLAGMERRAAELGGRIVFDSAPGRGCDVRVTIPLETTLPRRREKW
ncbi:MAG: ATP-binding protein, partial [Kiritimatiellae bacterium]|nr:ATP-binding protein [Kiritimatiellia bacterium]